MLFNIQEMPKHESYRYSGIDWLGRIPSGWDLKRFKHLYASAMGETILAEDLIENGSIPVYSATEGNHFFGFVEKSRLLLKMGDLVIPARGNSIGYPKLVTTRATCSQTTIYAKQIKPINHKFTYYYLLGCKPYLFQFVQTAIPQITVDEVKNNYLLVPSDSDQKLVVDYLDKKIAQLDEAIAIKQQQISLLKERKQIIIQKAVTQGLDPNVPMKDSGVDWISQIPEHWEMKRVKHLFKMVMEPSEKNNNHELLSVYTDIGVKPRRELEERGNKASTTDGYWFVKKGDIIVNKLLAWMGAIGISEYDGVTSPAYDILRSTVPVNGYFYHYLFRSSFCSAELKRHSRGIMDMRLRLYFDKFGVIEVPYPPAEEQDEIIRNLESQFSQLDDGIEHLKFHIDKLKEYKTTLINSAVTGKIKITPEMVES